MGFKMGKYYKHSGGTTMHICGIANSHMWGRCIVAEEDGLTLRPCAMDDIAEQNWYEITEEEYKQTNFSK